jgi:hypothetical protein
MTQRQVWIQVTYQTVSHDNVRRFVTWRCPGRLTRCKGEGEGEGYLNAV